MALPGMTESDSTPTGRAWWKRPRMWVIAMVVVIVATSIAGVGLLTDGSGTVRSAALSSKKVSQDRRDIPRGYVIILQAGRVCLRGTSWRIRRPCEWGWIRDGRVHR